MRTLIDKILRTGIKLCMLTGVAFTFAACYAPAPYDEEWYREYNPDSQKSKQKIEQQIYEASSDNSVVAGESEAH